MFFKSGGYVYHVGIYAGAGRIWHAPKPGDHVKLATLWTSTCPTAGCADPTRARHNGGMPTPSLVVGFDLDLTLVDSRERS